MTASAPRSAWTFDDLDGLPEDGSRYEIIEGRLLVSPAPALPHFRALSQLHRLLVTQAPEHYVVGQNGGVLTGLERDTYLIPDLVILLDKTLDSDAVALVPDEVLVAVEVLSPGSRSADLVVKRYHYARIGIPQYWIVDPAAVQLLVLSGRDGDMYREERVVRQGVQWRTDEPFPLTLDPADFC
jgi:Uma2 family endonuclease